MQKHKPNQGEEANTTPETPLPKKHTEQEELDTEIAQYYPSGEYDYTDTEQTEKAYTENMEKKKNTRRKKERLSRGQIGLIVAIFIVYTFVLLTASWIIFYRPSVPRGNTEVPFDTTPVINESEETKETSETEKHGEVGGNTYTDKGESYNILLAGHDRAAVLADVIMLVNCNTKTGAVTVMQIPRDTCIQNFVTNKINASFATYYSEGYQKSAEDPRLYAIQSMAEMLEQSLCIQIHHVAAMNLDGLVNIVNALGGVELYVPRDMQYKDPEQGLYIDLKEGYQTLTGEQAEGFVRFRSGFLQADLGRVNAQKIFLTALLQKVKSTLSITNLDKLTNVASEISKNLHTDMTVSDILFYGKFMLGVDLADVNMMTLPGNADYSTRGDSFYIMNRAATLQTINAYFNIYNKEITDSIFDRNRLFCLDDAVVTEWYNAAAEKVFDKVYNGKTIQDDSIYIP